MAVRLEAEGGTVARIAEPRELDGAVAGLGGVDVLVTVFSERRDGLVLDLDEDEWQRILDATCGTPS